MRSICIAVCLALLGVLALPVRGDPEEVRVRFADCHDLGVPCPNTNAPRSLVIKLRALKGSTLEMRKGEVDLPSCAFLPLAIDIEGPYCDGTHLNLRARNQHPDYWRNRPPPSVELSVHRLNGRTRVAVPFRVTSGGAGSPLYAEVLILEPEALRHAKLREHAREHAERFFAFSRQHLGTGAGAEGAMTSDRYIGVLDLRYQYAPPGYYEVVARYAPPADAECPEALESEPLGVEVYEAGDSLSKWRAEAAGSHE